MNSRESGLGAGDLTERMKRAPSPEPRAPSRLPRQVKLFGWVSLLNDFASEMIYPLLPAFVTGVLGAGPQALGALDGAAEFAAAFVKLGAGRLADRVPLRGPMIVLGYFIAVVVRPVIAITGAAWQVIGLRVVDRLGKGLRTPPRDALIADVTPAELRGRAFGLQRGMDHAGAVLGPILAWWLLVSGSANVRTVIGASIAPGVVVLVLAVVGGVARVRDARRGHGARGHSGSGLGAVPGVGARVGTDGEPGVGAGGAARGFAPGERVRSVSRSHGVCGIDWRGGAGSGVPAIRRRDRVSGERGGGDGARAGLATQVMERRAPSARVNPRLGSCPT